MKNEFIEKVEEWIENPDAVTQEELEANYEAAHAHADDVGSPYIAAVAAAYAAAAAADDDEGGKYWVNRYHKLTGE